MIVIDQIFFQTLRQLEILVIIERKVPALGEIPVFLGTPDIVKIQIEAILAEEKFKRFCFEGIRAGWMDYTGISLISSPLNSKMYSLVSN
jgi:hypothetical protein